VFNINSAFKMSDFNPIVPGIYLSPNWHKPVRNSEGEWYVPKSATYYFDSEIDGMQPLPLGPVPLNDDGSSFIAQRVNEQGELVWV